MNDTIVPMPKIDQQHLFQRSWWSMPTTRAPLAGPDGMLTGG